MNSFWNQKLKARKAVFFKQYRNARLNEVFSEELQKKKPEIPRKFLPVIKDYESEEGKQIKLELAKEKVKTQLKLEDIYKKRQLKTIKNIDTERTNYVAEHHSKELTEKLLKHWEQAFKSTETRAKVSLKRKYWLKKKKMVVEKVHKKPQNLPHERNNEYKMKERRNPWKESPKRKLNEKETSNDQLKRQQDQCFTNDTESARSDDTLVEML